MSVLTLTMADEGNTQPENGSSSNTSSSSSSKAGKPSGTAGPTSMPDDAPDSLVQLFRELQEVQDRLLQEASATRFLRTRDDARPSSSKEQPQGRTPVAEREERKDSSTSVDHHQLPLLMSHTYYETMLPLLIAVALVPNNEPSDFARLFDHFAPPALSPGTSTLNLTRFVLRLRTALFKAVPLVGVPRIINALDALHEAVVKHPASTAVLAQLPQHSTKPTFTTQEDRTAGWNFFKAIYTKHAEAILDKIGKTNPDLSEMIVDELYGANLSRTEVLSWRETVLIEFVGW